MLNGWLYNWEGIATMGSRAQRHVLVESLLVVYLRVFAISNRCSKDSFCAHKGASDQLAPPQYVERWT